ncbi:MAG: hypothetical protein OEV91_07655 [Desulfobulbaceae bacterium]|nr:hypothetical protein [Desulfobulbaceae bacterium]
MRKTLLFAIAWVLLSAGNGVAYMGPGMMGWGMMPYGGEVDEPNPCYMGGGMWADNCSMMGPNMMGGYGMGPGMMHGYGMGPGMMYGYGPGAGMMGPGMMRGYGMGPGMTDWGQGYGRGYERQEGPSEEEYNKFMDATAELRKKIHDKQFEYMERRRNPKASREELQKMEKELFELRQQMHEKGRETFGK